MSNATKLILAITFLILASNLSGVAFAADKMTYETYLAELKTYQDRETATLKAIEEENAAIADMRKEIADLTAQIKKVWQDIYAFLGVTEEQIKAFMDKISNLEAQVDQLARLTPANLLERASELDTLEAKANEMMGNIIATLSEPRDRLDKMVARIQALRASLPKPQHDMYSVLRGDYLWRISGKNQIYGDPWKWMRIYSANRSEIKDPDLIYPDQKLRIPRQIDRRNEYLVVKGDYLAKIAGYAEVYGDPFQWTKIYQANKSGSFIENPNQIYPEMILSIPR